MVQSRLAANHCRLQCGLEAKLSATYTAAVVVLGKHAVFFLLGTILSVSGTASPAVQIIIITATDALILLGC